MKNLILKIVVSAIILAAGLFYIVKFDQDNFGNKQALPVNYVAGK